MNIVTRVHTDITNEKPRFHITGECGHTNIRLSGTPPREGDAYDCPKCSYQKHNFKDTQ